MLYLVPIRDEDDLMRTTIAVDDELFAAAAAFTGRTEKSAIVRAALKLH